jgi:hypothetical protein
VNPLQVWKYAVPIGDAFELRMPRGARCLTVQVQGAGLCLWALVDPSAPLETRRFLFRGTGHEIDYGYAELVWVGTFQLEGGALVFHVFEVLT